MALMGPKSKPAPTRNCITTRTEARGLLPFVEQLPAAHWSFAAPLPFGEKKVIRVWWLVGQLVELDGETCGVRALLGGPIGHRGEPNQPKFY